MRNSKAWVGLVLFIILLLITITSSAEGLMIPKNVEIIESEAFLGISATSITIPASTNRIESKAFAECVHLTDVFLPQKTLEIADDSFDAKPITFHVYLGSDNETWAKEHGFDVAYISEEIEEPSARSDAIAQSVISRATTESLADGSSSTKRLILRTLPGVELPALDAYGQTEGYPIIVHVEDTLYLIQFENSVYSEKCYSALSTWNGKKYVQYDYMIVGTNEPLSNGSLRAAGTNTSTSDPMGFAIYTNYLKNKGVSGNVTVAVIDSGVNASQVGCTISPDSYDFITGENSISFSGDHGTKVAKIIADSFGSLSNHLTIISYRVWNPTGGSTTCWTIGRAIKRANNDGANLVNISIAEAYKPGQEDPYLEEQIGLFGKGRVIAAAGNDERNADRFLPARYCTSVSIAEAYSDGVYITKDHTARNADYTAYVDSAETSYAAPKITAAKALLYLDSDSPSLNTVLVPVKNNANSDSSYNGGMPDLSRIPFVYISGINIPDYPNNDCIMEVGEERTIQFTITPDNATNPVVNVHALDETILEVQEQGTDYVLVKAKSPGNTSLIFSATDGSGITTVVNFSIIQKPVRIILNKAHDGILYKGKTVAITATVEPDNTTDPEVLWVSSNQEIATVEGQGAYNQTGIVSQKGEGTATIFAFAKADMSVYASTTVTVSPLDEEAEVIISPDNATLLIRSSGETVQLNATVKPDTASQVVTWYSNNTNIATVNSNGLVTAVYAGTNGMSEAIITAKSVNGITDYATITVIQMPTSLTLSGSTSVKKGNSITLTPNVSPSNTYNKKVTWTSSDSGIATVSNGVVTGKANGMVTITAKMEADPNISASYSVRVIVPVESVSINNPTTRTIDVGGSTLSLSASISPSDATDKTITWQSDNTTVATVSSNGVVTPKSSGQATISAKAANGKSDQIVITVRQPYTLIFNSNGGSSVSNWTCYSGYAIGGTLPTPTRKGYLLSGWFTSDNKPVTTSTAFTSSTSVTINASWTAITYTVTLNNQNATTEGSTSVKATYNAAMPSITLPTKTGHAFKGYYTSTGGGGTQYYTATGASARNWNLTSNTTLYAYWTANSYSYSIVYKSSNGTALGTSSITKTFGTTNTVTPPAYTGYNTPSAQNVTWDATSKTITFVYSPSGVNYTSYNNVHLYNSPPQTYSATIRYRNRTATSVEMQVELTITMPKKTSSRNWINGYEQRLSGKIGTSTIPVLVVVKRNLWGTASSSDRSQTATTAWISVPVTATQTKVDVEIIIKQYNGAYPNGTQLSTVTDHTYEVSIPTY